MMELPMGVRTGCQPRQEALMSDLNSLLYRQLDRDMASRGRLFGRALNAALPILRCEARDGQ